MNTRLKLAAALLAASSALVACGRGAVRIESPEQPYSIRVAARF